MEKLTAADVQAWLEQLCEDPSGRSVGTPANRQASRLFISQALQCGALAHIEEFDCLDFEPGEVIISSGDDTFEASASPYSHSCDLWAELVEASTPEQLYDTRLAGKILLLHGQIVETQIMPKKFVFYNPEEHQRLVQYLESSGVAAVISASPPMPELNAAVYPCPMFEDGDLAFPSVYMAKEEGDRLLSHKGQVIHLQSTASRIASKAIHAVASFGPTDGKVILICAHLDTKMNTPGASDNAGGTAVCLALLHLLQDYQGPFRVQILPFNGEDYYAVPGEMLYLRDFEPARMELCVNMDSVGVKDSGTGYCHFNMEGAALEMFMARFGSRDAYAEIEQWYQGDHAIFAMQGVPTVAFSTQDLMSFFTQYAHTERDTVDKMDSGKLLDLAIGIAEFIQGYE